MDAEKVSEYNMALEISHLVTIGCSYTYCQGLEDPTTQGWPALLAQKLNVPVVNLGIMGSGNDSIYRRATEYYYLNKTTNSKPFFIVAFSQALRREEYLAEYKGTTVGDFRTLACYGDEPIERAIYEHIDTNGVYFMERRKLMHWLSIINMFKANNVSYFTTSYMADHQQSLTMIKNNYPTLFSAVHDDENRIEDFYHLTKGFPLTECNHDGLEAQQIVANYCYDTMLKKFEKIIPVTCDYVDLKTYVKNIDSSPTHDVWSYNLWYQKEINNVQPQ